MLEFLQSKEDFVGRLLQHLGTSAIMDMLLRLVTCMQSIECRLACVQVSAKSSLKLLSLFSLHPALLSLHPCHSYSPLLSNHFSLTRLTTIACRLLQLLTQVYEQNTDLA
jgi:hypothetical protein